MTEPSVAGGFDMLAASIRADSADLRTYLDVVGAKLADALPGSVTVEREGGLLAREHRVRRVTLRLQGRVFRLEWTGGDLAAAIDQVPVQLDRWSQTLAELLSEHAHSESQARTAMDDLVAGRLPTKLLSRPDGGSIVARHPDPHFALQSEVAVGPGDSAVLVAGSDVFGPLAPGRHALADVVPGAGDPVTAGVDAALYFVSTADRPNQRFGGAVDKVLDPATGLAVGLRVFGEYVARVSDPAALVKSLATGQASVTDERITDLLRDVVLRVLRVDLAKHLASQGWPILGLAAHTDDLEHEALARIREQAGPFGLEVSRFGNFTINMKEEDETLLTEHLARRAQGSVAAPAAVACASCGASNLEGAKFCSSCGKPLSTSCAQCGAATTPGSKFCSSCGMALTS